MTAIALAIALTLSMNAGTVDPDLSPTVSGAGSCSGYGPACAAFVARMIEHKNGVLLVPARTEVQWFQRAAKAARCVSFARDRIHFIRQDGLQARSSFGSVFMAFGKDAGWQLRSADFGWTP